MQRPQIALALRARAILLAFEKIYSCLYMPNCTRNHVITCTNRIQIELFRSRKTLQRDWLAISIWTATNYTSTRNRLWVTTVSMSPAHLEVLSCLHLNYEKIISSRVLTMIISCSFTKFISCQRLCGAAIRRGPLVRLDVTLLSKMSPIIKNMTYEWATTCRGTLTIFKMK